MKVSTGIEQLDQNQLSDDVIGYFKRVISGFRLAFALASSTETGLLDRELKNKLISSVKDAIRQVVTAP